MNFVLSIILLFAMKTPPPKITTQPVSVTVKAPAPATFSVVASGSKLSYQWLGNGGNIAGATATSYTIPTTTLAMNGETFQVKVSNSGGTVASGTATLTVVAAAQTITMSSSFTLPQATVGTAYSTSIGSDANVLLNGGPCTGCSYAVTTGAAPAGLTLSSAGILSGNPTFAGTTSFVITVTAPSGAKAKIKMGQRATH